MNNIKNTIKLTTSARSATSPSSTNLVAGTWCLCHEWHFNIKNEVLPSLLLRDTVHLDAGLCTWRLGQSKIALSIQERYLWVATHKQVAGGPILKKVNGCLFLPRDTTALCKFVKWIWWIYQSQTMDKVKYVRIQCCPKAVSTRY